MCVASPSNSISDRRGTFGSASSTRPIRKLKNHGLGQTKSLSGGIVTRPDRAFAFERLARLTSFRVCADRGPGCVRSVRYSSTNRCYHHQAAEGHGSFVLCLLGGVYFLVIIYLTEQMAGG
jgi:hypothetical protein